LFFEVTKTETPDDDANKPVIDLHSVAADPTASPAVAASGDAPDGTDDDATMVVIEPRNPGTATVTVTVRDVDNASSQASFMVTVVAEGTNSAPTVSTIDPPDLPDQIGDATATVNKRLKIGESRTIIDGDDFDAHFTDPNFDRGNDTGDYLTISVKYFAADIDADEAILPATEELDADKVGVSANRSEWIWGGDPNTEFTLTLTGVRGTATSDQADERGHVVALVATDTYGESVARVFRVMVNNRPKAEGAQASDPLTLGGEDDYMDLDFFLVDVPGDNVAVPLVVNDAGYFHDPDGDALTCRINNSTGGDVAEFTLDSAGRELTINPEERGNASATIACVDTFEDHSPDATLNVKVTHQTQSQQ
jgi:hypothetical protein